MCSGDVYRVVSLSSREEAGLLTPNLMKLGTTCGRGGGSSNNRCRGEACWEAEQVIQAAHAL